MVRARDSRGRFVAEVKFTADTTQLNQGLELAGKAFAAMDQAIGQTIGRFAKLEKALAEVSTLVDTTTFDMKGLEKAAIGMSMQFGTSAVAQTKAFYQAISAGASDAASAQRVLDEANKLALGGVTDIETAVDGLTSVMNAFGVQQEELGGVSESFFTAMKAGKTTVEELSRSIGKIAPTANSAGVGMDEMFAAIAAVTTQGIKTSEAVTGVNQALVSVLKPTKDAREEAERLGVEFTAAGLKSKGLKGLLDEIQGSAKFTDTSFVKLFGSVEAFKAVLALAANDGAKFNEVLELMEDKAGAAEDAVAKMQNTLDFQWSRVENAIVGVAAAIGGVAAEASNATAATGGTADFLEDLELIIREGRAMDAMNFNLERGFSDTASAMERVHKVAQSVRDGFEEAARAAAKTNAELVKVSAHPFGPEVAAGFFPQPAPPTERRRRAREPDEEAQKAAKKAAEEQDRRDLAFSQRQDARREAQFVKQQDLLKRLQAFDRQTRQEILEVNDAFNIEELEAAVEVAEKKREMERDFFDEQDRLEEDRAEKRRQRRQQELDDHAAEMQRAAEDAAREWENQMALVGNAIFDVFEAGITDAENFGQAVSKIILRLGLQIARSQFLKGLSTLAVKVGAVAAAPATGGTSAVALLANQGGRVPHFQHGGEVTGGVPGRDSVLGALTPGEVVLPVDVVESIRDVMGRDARRAPGGLQAFQDGGEVSGGGGAQVVIQLAGPAPPSAQETQRWIVENFAPAFRDLQELGQV